MRSPRAAWFCGAFGARVPLVGGYQPREEELVSMNISIPIQSLIDAAGQVRFQTGDQTAHPRERIAGLPAPDFFQLRFHGLAYKLRQGDIESRGGGFQIRGQIFGQSDQYDKKTRTGL